MRRAPSLVLALVASVAVASGARAQSPARRFAVRAAMQGGRVVKGER